MKRIGVFGGTFDPPHAGHMAVAEAALRQCGLDEVWLMVSPENPFKSGRRMTPEAARLDMARLAVASLPAESRARIKVSDFEVGLPRPTYTINTLHGLDRQYPGCRFSIIIGGDNLSSFGKWRDSEEIASRYGIIAYPRPGEELPAETQMPPGCVILKDVLPMDVSSTRIREVLKSAGCPDADIAVAPDVVRYIKENHIYDRD